MVRTSGALHQFLPRFLALLGVAGLVVLAVTAPPARTASAASDIQVFVGYADNLRANPTHFPTPWAGSPDVTLAGCQPASSCTYDSGAARLVNNTAAAVTIGSVVLKFDTCTYDIWPHGTVLQPGHQLIVTQTASGAGAGCHPETGLMDSSDIGPNGVDWVGHCNNSGIVPEVDVSIDGHTNAFRDTGQVLNTGGVDLADCPTPGANESTQWTLIGSAPCPGATLTLAPPTQVHRVGSTATVQAALRNVCGTPLAGAMVDFSILSGPNATGGGHDVTDAAGMATFSYSSRMAGTDVLRASVTNPAGTFTSNTVTVQWRSREHMTGRAYGLWSGGLLGIPRIPDTGEVATFGASTVAPPCVLTVSGGAIRAHTLCARVVTSAGPGTSTANASVQDARIGTIGMPVISIGVLQSASRTTCSGSIGQATILSIRIGGHVLHVALHPDPNTTLHVLGVTLVLNEQTPVAGADQGLQVNALHVIVPGVLNAVFASSTSDIHGC